MYTVAYLIALTILSVPVWALNVDLAWSLSLDNVYNGSEMKQVLLIELNNYYTVNPCGRCFSFCKSFLAI